MSGVKKTVDNTRQLLYAVAALTKSEVLVGVPSSRNSRKDGPIGNASLAYIHEFGSPAQNIPARPFIYPGIKKAQAQITAIMAKGARDAISTGDTEAASNILEKIGLVARNSVVNEITDPEPPYAPLQPATIRGRLRRTAAGRRRLREIKAGGKQLGMSMSQILTSYAQSSWTGAGANIKPLIDTGALRASITYVVRRS